MKRAFVGYNLWVDYFPQLLFRTEVSAVNWKVALKFRTEGIFNAVDDNMLPVMKYLNGDDMAPIALAEFISALNSHSKNEGLKKMTNKLRSKGLL